VNDASPSQPTLSAGVIVVRETLLGWRALLLRSYRHWDFPKGQVEPGETPLDAARRETREETGIDGLSFDWGEDYHQTAPYGRGKVARYYLARTATAAVTLGINPTLGRPEHHEYRWVSLGRARSLLNPRVRQALDWALERMALAPQAGGAGT
jgi:8-oxo-dGTP pyrophosphatase MutT (NUDIX family)